MPKKDKKGRRAVFPAVAAPEEDETGSIASDVTDSTCHCSDDESSQVEEEVYEKKIKEAMDLATEKSVQTRTNALISLKTALQKRIVTTFLIDHYQTLSDLIERSLKKGKVEEQVVASKLASALVLSLFGTDEAEQVYKILSPVLSVIVQDPTISEKSRQEVASSLALIAFLACPESSDLPATLNILHNIFCHSLPKGNGELPNHSQAAVSLHAAALHGVCLLLTLLSRTTVYTMAPKLLEELVPVLMSPDLDLRIMVGEALALIYESAREHSVDFRWRKQGMLMEKLNEFVNESNKYKGKKDLKVQRASFREIIHSIGKGDPFSEIVTLGPSQLSQDLVLSNWALRFQYNAICHALEQGLNTHMTYNPALRDHFDLGPPPMPAALKLRNTQKRPNRQTPEAKARIVARGKNRDNRAAALSYEG